MKENETNSGNGIFTLKCKICGNESDNELIVAQERQLGTGDKFRLFYMFEMLLPSDKRYT